MTTITFVPNFSISIYFLFLSFSNALSICIILHLFASIDYHEQIKKLCSEKEQKHYYVLIVSAITAIFLTIIWIYLILNKEENKCLSIIFAFLILLSLIVNWILVALKETKNLKDFIFNLVRILIALFGFFEFSVSDFFKSFFKNKKLKQIAVLEKININLYDKILNIKYIYINDLKHKYRNNSSDNKFDKKLKKLGEKNINLKHIFKKIVKK